MGEEYAFPFGDMMDSAFSALNAYIAALPALRQEMGKWQDATFYYAAQPQPDFIVLAFDDLAAAEWKTVDRLDGQTVRDRQIVAYNEGLRDQIGGGLGFKLPAINLNEVNKYALTNSYSDADNMAAFDSAWHAD